jgi:hypothetical protein
MAHGFGASHWVRTFVPGAHYMDFMVYDFDGDGKAEMMCRTAPGSQDGLGNYVGSLAKWQTSNGPHPRSTTPDDYRFNNPNPNTTNGYVMHGPEFITVFNGLTGEELATTTWYPKRDPDNDNDNPTASRINTVWGDSYGNRLDRFLAGIAFCDGIGPVQSFVEVTTRGRMSQPGTGAMANSRSVGLSAVIRRTSPIAGRARTVCPSAMLTVTAKMKCFTALLQ